MMKGFPIIRLLIYKFPPILLIFAKTTIVPKTNETRFLVAQANQENNFHLIMWGIYKQVNRKARDSVNY